MNLYLITQTVCNGYDTYDAAIVAADTPEQAAIQHPNGRDIASSRNSRTSRTWADTPNDVEVRLIGVAVGGTKAGVICASFNAG